MAGNHEMDRHPLPDLSDPSQRHENRDVNIWAIGKVGIALGITTIASLLLVLGVFHYLETLDNATRTAHPTQATALPPEPRLLDNEPENLRQVRAAENRLLNGYSWADQQHTKVKIPIDRAIDMLVQRGLPSRNGTAATDTASIPTESSLGPKVQQPGGPLAGSEGK